MELKFKLIKLKKDDPLFFEGDAPKEMFLIKSGVIASYIKRKDRIIELFRTQKGQLIGEMSFFKPEPRTTSARAIEDSEVFVIPFDAVGKSVENFPVWAKMLIQSLGNQVFTYQKELKEFRIPDDGTISVINRQLIRYLSALLFCAYRSGREPVLIDRAELKSITGQVFVLPPNRMEQLIKVLEKQNVISLSDQFIELFETRRLEETLKVLRKYFLKRQELLEPSLNEMKFLSALCEVAKSCEPTAKGVVQVPASNVLEKLAEQGGPVDLTLVDQVINRGLQFEKVLGNEGVELKFQLAEIREFSVCWSLILPIHNDNPFRGQ